MTNEEFYKMFEGMHAVEHNIMVGKGKEYTKGDDDKLKNFKEVGERLGLTPKQVWAVYFYKHLFSLEYYLKGGEISSGETIESRITDLRNYLALLVGLIREE